MKIATQGRSASQVRDDRLGTTRGAHRSVVAGEYLLGGVYVAVREPRESLGRLPGGEARNEGGG